MNPRKESIMTKVTVNKEQAANVNPATTIKEETIMTGLTKEQVNEMGTMTMRKKIIDLGYDTVEIKKNVKGKNVTEKYRTFLLSLIKDEDGNTQEVTETDVEADISEQIEIHESIHGVVSTGDFTYDKAPAQEKEDNYEAKAKTDKLFALIKARAADNEKKGFGYTISSFMLQACILDAGAGIKKMKGHVVTTEEDEMTQRVYSWLKDNGFIEPCVYSVQEDEKVRIFMPNYPGKLENTTVRMIPYDKSGGYTAKKITSFLVILK